MDGQPRPGPYDADVVPFIHQFSIDLGTVEKKSPT